MQTEGSAKRFAHDVAQAHSLLRALDAEKARLSTNFGFTGPYPVPSPPTKGVMVTPLEEVVQRCASVWESEPSLPRRVLSACCSYLWRVHGVSYFSCLELPLAEFGGRLARSCAAVPVDAGTGAAWEGAVDKAWSTRLVQGDPVLPMLGRASIEAAVEAFVSGAVKKQGESRCATQQFTYVKTLLWHSLLAGSRAMYRDVRSSSKVPNSCASMLLPNTGRTWNKRACEQRTMCMPQTTLATQLPQSLCLFPRSSLARAARLVGGKAIVLLAATMLEVADAGATTLTRLTLGTASRHNRHP